MKKLQNSTGLKVSFVPQSGKSGSVDRIKITQTNCNKTVFVSANIDVQISDFISSILESIEVVKSYSVQVDNTQSNYQLFNLDFVGPSFDNILGYFKPNKYKINFLGVNVGAGGVRQKFTITIEAVNFESAKLKMYDTHEHIQILKVNNKPVNKDYTFDEF